MASPTPPPAASARVAVVAAEADGVSPSLLVTCATGAKRQYLFSCAEGFSRLALEHRARPSAKPRAVFLPSLHPRACGGLGGTLLRLCADGHERVHVVGPPGVGAHVDALRALVRFRHPDVPVLALVPPGGEPPGRDDPCDAAAEEYRDDSVCVFPLFEQAGGRCQLCEAEEAVSYTHLTLPTILLV